VAALALSPSTAAALALSAPTAAVGTLARRRPGLGEEVPQRRVPW